MEGTVLKRYPSISHYIGKLTQLCPLHLVFFAVSVI